MPPSKRHFFSHLHPVMVYRRTLSPSTTLGMGMACLTCLGVLLVTGATLFLYYTPDTTVAYERILHITTTLYFGRLIRNLHFVAANALIVLVFLHMARVFFTAAYKSRSLNWQYGLVLLLLVLFANFTGYVLPWDQVAYWATKVASSLAEYIPFIGGGLRRFLLGGSQVGVETLLRSFAFHAGVIPPLIVGFTGLHLWRIRKDGGLASPPHQLGDKIPADPWLYRAEASVALLTLALLLFLALGVDAPLFERADPNHPPNPAKAPWYFVGFQELVSYSAFWGGVAVPLFLFIFFVLAPYLDRTASPPGMWFARDRLLLNVFFGALLLSQVGFIIVGQWLRGPNWGLIWPF